MSCCGNDASSDMRAKVTEVPATKNATGPGYSIQGYEDLKYTYSFVDNVFDQKKEDLAAYYTKWGRVLCVLDENLNEIYGESIKACKFFLSSQFAHSSYLWSVASLCAALTCYTRQQMSPHLSECC